MAIVAVTCLAAAGCGWFDQAEVTRDKGDRLMVPILNQIDPADESEMEFTEAQDVRPQDLKAVAADYIIGANDLLQISVYDLVGPGGVETTKISRVSETGYISLPMLPEPLKTSDKTEFQLQKDIVAAYDQAKVLTAARVSVNVVEQRGKTFSILGAVARSGQYPIVEADFRILNALVQAGDTTSPADFLYVVRKVRSEQPSTRPARTEPPTTTRPATKEPDLAPGAQISSELQPILALAAAPTTRPAELAPPSIIPPEPRIAPVVPTTRPVLRDDGSAAPLENIEGHTRTMGTTQPVVPPVPTPPVERAAEATTRPAFEFGAGLAPDDTRVIRVPLGQLKMGDLRYNIVVRPGDVLIVPPPTIGFYYMAGHVGAPGAYNMTGQKITLKQAIAAARMLDPFAVPARTDVIRRVGNNEVFVRVDLYQVFNGLQPDLYLKPNDTVVVGTDWYPTFLQAIRGAFRFTYGFGFLYDRNYAPFQKGYGGVGG